MIIVLIHWRIRQEREQIEKFLNFWRSEAIVRDRRGMVGEFLNEALVPKDIGYITWHLDPDSLGTFKSFVNVGIWDDEKAFHEQIGQYFNDDMPVKGRGGQAAHPTDRSDSV